MLHRHVSKVTRNGQNQTSTLERGFCLLQAIIGAPIHSEEKSDLRGIQLVVIFNLPARCHQVLHTGPLKRNCVLDTTAALCAEHSRVWSSCNIMKTSGTVTWGVFDCVWVCAYMLLVSALSYIQTKCISWGQYYIIKLTRGIFPFFGCASASCSLNQSELVFVRLRPF